MRHSRFRPKDGEPIFHHNDRVLILGFDASRSAVEEGFLAWKQMRPPLVATACFSEAWVPGGGLLFDPTRTDLEHSALRTPDSVETTDFKDHHGRHTRIALIEYDAPDDHGEPAHPLYALIRDTRGFCDRMDAISQLVAFDARYSWRSMRPATHKIFLEIEEYARSALYAANCQHHGFF